MASFYKFGTLKGTLRDNLRAAFDLVTGHDHDGVNSKAITFGELSLANGKILVGSAGNLAAPVTPSGDVTMTNAGVTAIGAGKVTLAQLAATAKTHFITVPIEDLAAGADIAARAVFAVPAGMTATLVKASLIMQGAAAGVDAGNTCVVVLSDGTNTIVTKTYNDAAPMPAENAEGDLGALDAEHKVLAAGERLHFAVTNGATADTPKMVLQVALTLADAA